ncbi:ABC transporter substrate-binding protein [Sinomonas flava]|uniref:ABC transporter substrate-binding protein n=1 Tax=Sinomonas flava TaxID=496857 RepID=UPI0039A75B06
MAAAGLASLALAACGPSGDARTAQPGPSGDGVLRLGLILDSAGQSAYLNDAQRAAVVLAVQQANAAGGFKGKPVELLDAAVGEDTGSGAKRLAEAGADVVIGPTDSSRAPAAIDALAAAKVPLVSPAASAASLSDYRSGGFFFRTAAPEGAEGAALVELAKRAGAHRIAVLHEDSAYGKAVAAGAAGAASAAGLEESGSAEFGRGDVRSKAAGAKDADAVLVVARSDGRSVLTQLAEAGIPGSRLLLSDGLVDRYGSALANGVLDGARAAVPGAFPSIDFQTAVLEHEPGLKDMTFAAEAYDAAALAILAAGAAGDDAGASIASRLTSVSGGEAAGQGPGQAAGREKCSGLAACLAVQGRGTAVDYEGESGPIDFDGHGDVTTGRFMVLAFHADNLPAHDGEVTVAR